MSHRRRFLVIGLCAALGAAGIPAAPEALAEDKVLASTPPMGWNSWDSYGTTIKEAEVKANADFMAQKLASFGWQYIIVDIEWYQPNAKAHGYIPRGPVTIDAFGRFVPSPNRFPSAAGDAGFKSLADYVHAKGLKFGFHIMRGISREAVDKNLPIKGTNLHAADIADKVNVCRWPDMEDTYGVDMTKPGAQEYYDSIAQLYASWGADYIKADDMAGRWPEIHALSVALRKTGRPIVLSLSPGGSQPGRYDDLRANAQMWRISGDFWDRWSDVKRQFDNTKRWQGLVHPGGWPDADMLPLGHIGLRAERGDDRPSLLTHDEQYTLMSLWSIFRSPLMMGGDLPTSDAFTLDLLTNPEVLAVDQHSEAGYESYREAGIIAWTADVPSSDARYVAVFNTTDTDQNINLPWTAVGLRGAPTAIRDLWQRQDEKSTATLHTTLRPHASVLYRVAPPQRTIR